MFFIAVTRRAYVVYSYKYFMKLSSERIIGMSGFLKKKDIEISAHRYLIDAMSAMAQGLFASLLIGTILSTLGTQLGIPFLD